MTSVQVNEFHRFYLKFFPKYLTVLSTSLFIFFSDSSIYIKFYRKIVYEAYLWRDRVYVWERTPAENFMMKRSHTQRTPNCHNTTTAGSRDMTGVPTRGPGVGPLRLSSPVFGSPVLSHRRQTVSCRSRNANACTLGCVPLKGMVCIVLFHMKSIRSVINTTPVLSRSLQ